ncbi:cell division ATP-binding protein FtsE [Ligilactobacillus agilis]|jgi:cell division transport system ATP-binding protein|uniref:cell division ATP-binding protein FtsE n=1 Tax=Ligilactobacillus agilis TaxID=1601 RepID=UPI001437FF8C|nr:ATP-binding cassette domain-containing protein [Ligilactobacillus agilis]MDK6809374.1 ATP-binding cassette domain-containing protein [Ligilactobacillus agilis]MDO4456050.1 ATP-binding cassette domain-containing protein [Ligilactobacillus agilis]GET10311.1 cell division protein FtsE [Ligilactobacillus agilis]GET14172.1 cell division protein FtsE [Ligilactobacillus agilis]
MIRFKQVSKTYGENLALRQVNFEIKQGEFVYLIGPSGAGKSTIIKLLTREELATSGQVIIGNTDLSKLKAQHVYKLRRQLGIVNQQDVFLENRTVKENYQAVLGATGVAETEWLAKIKRTLDLVGLAAYLDAYPRQLSVGQKKRVAIGRAMLNRPKILLADEPTANLDPKTAIDIMRLFFRINRQQTTILMATHDSTIVNTFMRRVLELEEGKLIRDQAAGNYNVFGNPNDIYIL